MGLRGRPRTYHPDRPATNAEYRQRYARKRAEELQQLRRKLAQKVYHESKSLDWETPWPVFHEYDAEFLPTPFAISTGITLPVAQYVLETTRAGYSWGPQRRLAGGDLRAASWWKTGGSIAAIARQSA